MNGENKQVLRLARFYFVLLLFCYALAPGQFLLRIQAKANDLRRVVLHTMDKYLPLSVADTRQQQVMEKVTTDGIHDYFEARISLDMVCLRYFFALTDRHGKTVYYGNYRFFPEEIRNIDDMFDCPQTLRALPWLFPS